MDIKENFKNKLQSLREELPGVMRRSNKTLDPDLQKYFKNYKSDQQAKHSSNAVKTSWQASPNPTFRTMGMVKPWQSTDSKAKYDATRDKVVDKQNQREIRREPPITVKEENLNELRGKSSLSDDERKELKGRIHKKHGKAWDDTIDIRKEKKSSGPADTRDMDKLRNRLAKMYNKLEEAADDLSKKSTEELQKFIKDHAGGGVPRFGKGAAVQRHYAELKRRTSKKLEEAKLSYDDFTKGRVDKTSSDADLKDMIKKNNKRRGGGSDVMNRKYKEELSKRAKKLEEANSKNTVKIKRKYYTDKAKEMEAERHDRFSSPNPVRRSMMTQVHGSVGSAKAKKSAHKLKRIKQAADVAGKMLKK
jgi:hypothetical protein